MRWETYAKQAIDMPLRFVGLELKRYQPKNDDKPWDSTFVRCLETAKKQGRDPNDVLDEVWSGTPSLPWIEKFVFPHFKEGYAVCEIGPGSGRFTRHLVNRASQLYLFDYSSYACGFLHKYFHGKGNVSIFHCADNRLHELSDDSVDLFFSMATFVHIEIEPFLSYLREAYRVLRPQRYAILEYASMTTPGGLEFFKGSVPTHYGPSIFRFHHPEKIRAIATDIGFEIANETIIEGGERPEHVIVELRKPEDKARPDTPPSQD